MTSHQKLDMVLSFLPSNHDYIPFSGLSLLYVVIAKGEAAGGTELLSILEVLIEDGYIEPAIKDKDWHSGNQVSQIIENSFKLTFKGRFWMEDGGYLGHHHQREDKSRRIENIENHQKAHQTYMTRLTLILTVFAFLSVFLQSLEKFHAVSRIEIWLALFLYTAAIFAGIAIWLLVQEVRSKLRK